MTEPIIIALIGVTGAVVGSVATLAGNFLMHWLKKRDEKNNEKPARALLTEMLNHNEYT